MREKEPAGMVLQINKCQCKGRAFVGAARCLTKYYMSKWYAGETCLDDALPYFAADRAGRSAAEFLYRTVHPFSYNQVWYTAEGNVIFCGTDLFPEDNIKNPGVLSNSGIVYLRYDRVLLHFE